MIVITTPTGQIGRQVLDRVLRAGEPVRVIVRDPARLSPRIREQVDVVTGSHHDRAVVEQAFAGADSVFWLVPPDPRAKSLEEAYIDFSRPACDAFISQGVARVVGISALGRGVPGNAGHVTASLAMDDLIAATGVGHRALTMPSFMDNTLRQVASIRDRGVFAEALPADLKLPICATRDIADVAAGLLLDHSWSGQGAVPVLGPEDLSCNDMARIMSEVLGRPVRFEPIPVESLTAVLTRRGLSEAMAQGLTDMAVAKGRGLDTAEPRTAQSSTPTTFRQWCQEVLKPAVPA